MRPRPLRTILLSLALPLAAAGCGDGSTAPVTGRLVVPISPLPPGVQLAVTVTGPGGINRSVSSSADTLSGLAPGTYTVTAPDVAIAGARYRATPAQQTIEVGGGTLAVADPIAYALGSARLGVTIDGLPAGASGSVTVSGPGSFTRTIGASTTLDLLEPGSWTITAADVQAGGAMYRASPPTQSLTLEPSTTPRTIEIWYGAMQGALALEIAGLPAAVDAAVTVTGPGGFARTVTGATTLRQLDPGTYTIETATVGSDLVTYRPSSGTQTVTVADQTTASASIAYTGAPLALAVELVADGLVLPVFMTAPEGDDRLFVVERAGRVRIVKDGTLRPGPFIDISARVNSSGERGLLGMAFDPWYTLSGIFYLYYVNLAGDVTLERFTSAPGSDVASGSGGIVLTIPHRGSEHHGGMIAFGPDGMLYIGPGDGRCCGDPDYNAQNLTTLLGKMLRIDVSTTPYTVPAGNPYLGRTDRRPEIWASGLRNPWRFSFDHASDVLYIGDVGQDAREEVNAMPAAEGGINYGWPRMEGNACYSPATNCDQGLTLTRPALDYTHDDGCSVTGGYVYRGAAIPELTGRYLYSDYCRGWLRSFRLAGGRAGELRSWEGVSVPRMVSFGQDGSGEVYMIGQTQLWRIVRR